MVYVAPAAIVTVPSGPGPTDGAVVVTVHPWPEFVPVPPSSSVAVFTIV